MKKNIILTVMINFLNLKKREKNKVEKFLKIIYVIGTRFEKESCYTLYLLVVLLYA